MATPAVLRKSVDQLVGFARRDMAALWREVSDAAQARTALMDILPALVETYGSAAATLAATWYDDAREKAAVRGAFAAIPVEPSDRGAQALAGWATTAATDVTSLQTLVLGGLQRRLMDSARETITRTTVADPGADGWQRVTDGDGCAFCEMLAGRATLYRTEETATFASHDWCGCGAAPAWGGQPRPVKPYTPSLRYSDDEAGRARKATDQARVREWLRTH